MANGVLCRCGYQEADHLGTMGILSEYSGDLEAMKKDHPRLAACKGYKPLSKAGFQKPENSSFYLEQD